MTEYTVSGEATKIVNTLAADPRLQFPEDVIAQIARTKHVSAIGTAKPILPTSLKLTETSVALWTAIAGFASAIINDRYGAENQQAVTVDIDRATTNLVSFVLVQFNGKSLLDPSLLPRHSLYDFRNTIGDRYRKHATNIYQTKDGKYFHLHGSIDADPTLTMLGMPLNRPDLKTDAEVIEVYSKEVKKHDAKWLDITANEHFRQAGTIAYTPEEFAATEHGKIISGKPVYELTKVYLELPPIAWPKPTKGTKRPLEGIKIIDVSRVVAAPQISKHLASLGASVIRVSSSDLPDLSVLLLESQLGKKDVALNLKTAEGKKALVDLISDADVFIDGFRPHALDRLGFSQEYVQFLAQQRGKGIVFVRENCYGYEGPWAHRSGWQQIADVVSGVAWEHGKFLGLTEPVLPIFPNSDYQTAFSAVIAILNALYQRKLHGGSYNVDVSLVGYNVFLLQQGLLPQEEQERLRKLTAEGSSPETSLLNLRHFHEVSGMFIKGVKHLQTFALGGFSPQSFGLADSNWGEPGEKITYLKAPIDFSGIELSYDVGTSPIGHHNHDAKW